MGEADTFWQFSLHEVLPRLGEGMLLTVELTLASGVIGLVLGLLLALARLSKLPCLRWPVMVYVAPSPSDLVYIFRFAAVGRYKVRRHASRDFGAVT